MKRLPFGIMALVAVAALDCCGSALQQTDIDEFLETGSANVLVRSTTFTAGSSALTRAVSGKPVSCDLVIINPKALDVCYTLGWDVDDALFTAPPATEPKPNSAVDLSFSFILAPAAEHKTINFNLDMYVAALDKKYAGHTFSILCDSPPNPPSRVATVMDSGQKSALAVRLPAEPSDDDLAALRITWSMEGSSTAKTGTYTVSSLSTPPSGNLFSSNYDCYFQADDCVAGNGYAYSVVVIDAAGQESSAVATTSTANSFFVNYNGNGNTGGEAPAATGYRFAATAVAASPGNLSKTGYAFSHWNTAADGSLTSYAPGATFTVPAGDVTLYAQWGVNTGVVVEIPTNYQALTFANTVPTITQGDVAEFQTTNAVLAAATTGWTWYIDGLEQSGETSPKLTLNAAKTQMMLGAYHITARVTYAGVTYSGNLTLTVHR